MAKSTNIKEEYISIKKIQINCLLYDLLNYCGLILTYTLLIVNALSPDSLFAQRSNKAKFITIFILSLCILDFFIRSAIHLSKEKENKIKEELSKKKEKDKIECYIDSCVKEEDKLERAIRYIIFASSSIFLIDQFLEVVEEFKPFGFYNNNNHLAFSFDDSVLLLATLLSFIAATLAIVNKARNTKDDKDQKKSYVNKEIALLGISAFGALISLAARFILNLERSGKVSFPITKILMITSLSISLFLCIYSIKDQFNQIVEDVINVERIDNAVKKVDKAIQTENLIQTGC